MPRYRLATRLLAVGTILFFTGYWTFSEIDFERILEFFSDLNTQLAQHPLILMASLAILPGIGFPISPLLILFGTSLTPQYGLVTTCLLGVAMQSLCTTWSFVMAAGPFKNWLTKWLNQHYTLPTLQNKGAITATLLIRLAPGFPYALQNIILGLIGVSLKTYLLISIPITALITCTFIVSGAAIIQANTKHLVVGFAILLLVVLGLRIGAKKFKKYVD